MRQFIEEKVDMRIFRRNGSDWVDEHIDVRLRDGVVYYVALHVYPAGSWDLKYHYTNNEEWIDGLAATLETIIFDNIALDLKTGAVQSFEYSWSHRLVEDREVLSSYGILINASDEEELEEDEELEDAYIT